MKRLIPFATTLLTLMLAPIAGQGRGAGGQQKIPSDLDIQQAAAAIEQADGYAEIVAATKRHAVVLSSPRVVELVDGLLNNSALDATQRGLLLLERQLSIDCRTLGAEAAANLLAVRVIAGSAIAADTAEQFAGVLDKFAPFAAAMTVELVRQALTASGDNNNWPKPIIPLMEQLAIDWPKLGALAAATKMAEAANVAPAPSPVPVPNPSPKPPPPGAKPTLVAHWRSTQIIFGDPLDEHVVLNANGTAETWQVTATSRTPVTRGKWNVKGTLLSVAWEDGRQWGQPFTFLDGQLVFPNVPNQRQFWEVIR